MLHTALFCRSLQLLVGSIDLHSTAEETREENKEYKNTVCDFCTALVATCDMRLDSSPHDFNGLEGFVTAATVEGFSVFLTSVTAAAAALTTVDGGFGAAARDRT